MVLPGILRVCTLRWGNSLATLHRCLHTSLIRSIDGTPIKMPSLSPTMSEGSIVKWYKAEGEEIQPGDVLCDIQTDKAVVSLENEEEGVLAKIIKDESVGDIKVGEIIALYVDQGEDWRSVDAEVSSESLTDDVSSESSTSASSESVRHTSILGPAVRNIRNTYDVDLSKVTPTGPQKNVLKEDILQYIKANNLKPKDFTVAPPHATSEKKQSKKTKALSVTSQPANEFIDIPLSETALQNMQFWTASKMATPHSYVYYDAGLDDLECLQERLLVEEGVSTELEDLIAKCVGHAMMLCPRLRCVHSSEDSVTQCDRADICWISVCEDGGSVMGSVLHDVGSAPLNDISSARQHQHVALSRELISPSTAAVPITIRDGHFKEAIDILSTIPESRLKSRAALSLLACCHYQLQQYDLSAEYYSELVTTQPQVPVYRLYLAQALYQTGRYQQAVSHCSQLLQVAELRDQVIKLQAAIRYMEGELAEARSLVEQCNSEDPDTVANQGCLLYRDGRYDDACAKFIEAQQLSGFVAHLSYNTALCHYQAKRYQSALKEIDLTIQNGIRRYPQLGVGLSTEGVECVSVGNTAVLHSSALVETFNLKAATEFQLKNYSAARDALTDIPPRSEQELDAVTLHNLAIMNMDSKGSDGFQKLQYLMMQSSFPPETFGNLLLLYFKYEYFDLAADVLAENAHLTYSCLTPSLYEYFDAVITEQTAPEEAYRKFDALSGKYADQLRKLTKQVQQARANKQESAVHVASTEYDHVLQGYIPVLMAQARIFWNQEQYDHVEKLFRRSVEFCSDSDVWKLNVAHVLFMQENKFKEATGFYEPIVRKHYDNILDVSAIVLANLCVSYIMTSQNEEAEELMRKIEKEEEALILNEPDKKIFHLCIVNLVIGTLYCSKGNYEFGISRVIKSMEPYQKKLGTDTWYYAKRCFLSLLEMLAKNMITSSDKTLEECLQFLHNCEAFGVTIPTQSESPLDRTTGRSGSNTVTFEARLLRRLFALYTTGES